MSGVLVDSSVLLDITSRNSQWFNWSSAQLERLRRDSDLFINQIIFAECVSAYRGAGDHRMAVEMIFERRSLPWEAAALAGDAHAAYRRRGGTRVTILADFLIAAHAKVDDLVLLTRDPARARMAFPELEIVAPEI